MTEEQVEKEDQGTDRPNISNAKRKAEWFEIDDEHNCYVYVSGLPKTMVEEEFVDLMKKYGIIATKNVHGSPYNIKMYKDKESGTFQGDALCRYVRKESVELAITFIDGLQYDSNHILHCEPAKFQLKGSYDPTKKPRVDPKAKLKQKKVAAKILSWEPPKEPLEMRQKKVILKHMFTLEEISKDAGLLIDLKEDVVERCKDLIAEPKRVDIYHNNPDGVIAVTFAEPEQAIACVDALNNQFYAERVVTAELWDGTTNYKIRETDEESEKRLEKWKQDILKSDDNDDSHVETELELGEIKQDLTPSLDDKIVSTENEDKT